MSFLPEDSNDLILLGLWIVGMILWCVFVDAVEPEILRYVKRLRGNRRI